MTGKINLGENYESVIKGISSHEVEPRKESQTREERIAAFRARKEELEKEVEELERKGGKKFDEAYQSAGAEAYDRGTAKHYNFDIEKINQAIEEAKKVESPRYRKQSIERLEAAKALIEKEIGVEVSPPTPEPAPSVVEEPLAGKKKEGVINDIKSPEGAPAPEPEKEESPASPNRGEPEMKAAVNELLGEELGGNAQMREAAAAVVEARRAMRDALATRKEERLYAEAGAGFIAPERLQEAERIEKTYEDALVGLSARMRESAGNNKEAFLAPYLNIQNAEAMRVAQMREAALTPERRNIAVRFYQRLNNPFNNDVPPRYARYVRVGLTAAALGGGAAMFGGMGAAGIAAFAGWRMSKSLAFAFANGIARSGIDMALTRHADVMMGEEKGKQKATMQEALKNNERVGSLEESLRASIRGFQSEAAAQLENRKFYGRAATFGLMGLSGLISYELARPSAVAADEGAFGSHIATNEDVLRQRFYGAWDRVQEGASATKQRAEEIAGNVTARADVIGKPSAGETVPSGGGITPPIYEEAPMRPGVPPPEGKPPLLTLEEMEKLQALREKGVLTEEQIDHLREAWEGKLDSVEKIAVIPKGGSVWETAMNMKRHGIMTTDQFNEAWEKSTVMIDGKEVPLRDAWLVHEKDALRFAETPQGPRLELIDAKDAFKVGTYKELGEAYDALGKEKPPALREALAQEQHVPSAAKRLEELANTKIARPAADPSMFEGIKNAPVAEGGSLSAILENPKSYIDTFEKASLADQEATIQKWEDELQNLRKLKGRPNIDAALLNDINKTEKMFAQLQGNEAYLGNVKAWEALEKEWVRKVGVSEAQFAELSNKWTVERFLDTAKKIENRDFVPSDPLSKILEARRIGTLEMAEGIRSELSDRSALKMPLGRFLKNTL